MSHSSFLVVLDYAVTSHYERAAGGGGGGGDERGVTIVSIFLVLPMMSSLMQKGHLADLSRELSTSDDLRSYNSIRN